MKRKKIASQFNGLIILTVLVLVLVSSVASTGYLLHRYTQDALEKDRLHNKGLASSVKGFVDHAFSLNYLLSINPAVIEAVASAEPDWIRRQAAYAASTGLRGRWGRTAAIRCWCACRPITNSPT